MGTAASQSAAAAGPANRRRHRSASLERHRSTSSITTTAKRARAQLHVPLVERLQPTSQEQARDLLEAWRRGSLHNDTWVMNLLARLRVLAPRIDQHQQQHHQHHSQPNKETEEAVPAAYAFAHAALDASPDAEFSGDVMGLRTALCERLLDRRPRPPSVPPAVATLCCRQALLVAVHAAHARVHGAASAASLARRRHSRHTAAHHSSSAGHDATGGSTSRLLARLPPHVRFTFQATTRLQLSHLQYMSSLDPVATAALIDDMLASAALVQHANWRLLVTPPSALTHAVCTH